MRAQRPPSTSWNSRRSAFLRKWRILNSKEEQEKYGQKILHALGTKLVTEFSQGFTARNLANMIRLAEVFPDIQIVSALGRQLNWTYFRSIIYLDDSLKRDFYPEMCRTLELDLSIPPLNHFTMSFPDAAYALKDPEEFTRRRTMLSLPHMQPLLSYLEGIRRRQGPEYHMPAFDPCDGGIHARLLFLLEAPGPKAVKSSFISHNNPDQTVRNMNQLLRDAGISRKDTVLWNIVPWYVGDGRKIRPVSRTDIQEAAPYLKELVSLLPNLLGIVLVGKKSQSARRELVNLTDVPFFETHHPSPQVFNVWPHKRAEAQAVFETLARLLGPSER